MAAKPPKPPGKFLKSLLNQHNNNNINNNKQLQQQHNNEDNDIESNNSGGLEISTTADCHTATPAIAATKRTNCNCSNISIMHLFHEMKQEFPTIPDTIVAQCVNENCHQRENCIQMLRNELELNPIPAQSYPAKVLHPPNNNNNIQQQHMTNNHYNINNNNNNANTTIQKPPLQQKPVVVQQKPPLKPIKPIRTAPLQPPTAVQQSNNNINNNCAKINSKFAKNSNTTTATKTTKEIAGGGGGGGENLANNEESTVVSEGAVGQSETNDMPTIIKPHYKQSIAKSTTRNSTTPNVTEVNNNDIVGVAENGERNLPRQRPTTLNLNTQLQKQQRQRLNVQLQQRFQEQRTRQQQQQPQNPTVLTKPLRKAPLPPIAPKPSHYHQNHTNSAVNNNSFYNDSLSSPNHTTTTTTSPLSESEISVNVSLSTPSPTSSTPNGTTHHQQHLQTKSPIRHRSVITLQPEPPYTRDFLFTPAPLSQPSSPCLAAPYNHTTATTANSSSSANSSPTASVTGSQKSYTSVNLTLRPPISPTGTNSALQPSTIDITAGPGFSGASGGGKSLHYSSTSYDARLGYQQNFQITVTDEGGVFSACRLRPQQQQQHYHQQQQQQQRCLNQQQQQQQQLQLQQQFHNNNVVALQQQNIQNSIQSPQGVGIANTSTGFGGSGGIIGNMCLPPQQAMDAPSQEILQRQKKKRDKLAAALREYKKRLGNVEQEINLLTGTIPTQGLSERLDEEITKLRRDCQDMLRSSNSFTQTPTQQELAINHQPQQQKQPQPFPRQMLTRPTQPRQTSLDIIQHHSQSNSPHTPPAASLPNLNMYNTPSQQQQQQQQQQLSATSPSYYHQHSSEPLINNINNSNTTMYTDSYYADQEPLVNDVDDDGEYEELVEPPWECNMCTFRNHAQLNICEACDNVRPGMLTNLSRALSATNCVNTNTTACAGAADAPAGAASSASSANLSLLGTGAGAVGGSNNALNTSNSNSSSRSGLNNTANGNLEHDLVQQQLQHFALHT